MVRKSAYRSPSVVDLGDVAEITKGTDSGFSDDGGAAGYKPEGGTISAEPFRALPRLREIAAD